MTTVPNRIAVSLPAQIHILNPERECEQEEDPAAGKGKLATPGTACSWAVPPAVGLFICPKPAPAAFVTAEGDEE